MTDKTFGNLKKRILDLLFEYDSDSDTVFVADGDRELISSRIPDAVNTALVRMYESLPFGVGESIQRLFCARDAVYERQMENGDNKELCLSAKNSEKAVFFRYFGKGNVVFTPVGDGREVSIECNGSGSLSEMRKIIFLEGTDFYGVTVDGSLKVYDFTVCDSSCFENEGAICSYTEKSFELPVDAQQIIFMENSGVEYDLDRTRYKGAYAFIPASMCEKDSLCVKYRKKAPVITKATSDAYVFDLSQLCFEALVVLAASEVCRQEDAALHTRLVYKYNDLCEAFYTGGIKRKRNTFFATSGKRRWLHG